MRLVAVLLLGSATLAHADDARDVFGFDKNTPPAPPPLDCRDGTAFGCIGASDPLAEHASPYSLSSWLSAAYLLSLPVADATHDAVAHYALGASRDDAGANFGGANGLENRWLVEGAPADGVRTGAADTRVPLAFLDGMWVTAGGFTARDRTSTGGVIDARLRGGTARHVLEARAFAGWTADARQRPIVPGSYFVRRGTLDVGPDASASLVATGPLGELLGGHAWYAAGIAPQLGATTFTWTAATETDVDHDHVADGSPGLLSTELVDRYSRTPLTWRVPLMARVGLDRGPHHIDLTLVGAVGNDVRYLYNATLQAAGVDGTSANGDGIATWRGRWTDTLVRGQLAWHRSIRRESARDPAAADIPQLASAYVPTMLADDPALAAACADDTPTDRYPMFTNCLVPVNFFFSGGAGKLTDVTADRPSITADVAHRVGANVLRAGATGEDARLITEARFTGGAQLHSLFDGHTSETRFIDPAQVCSSDAALPCPTVDRSLLRYRTRYTAAYVEDTWQADPRFAVDGGLRWELMWVGTTLHFSDQLAPRLGASWDVLGGGRSRLWTSMGRSFALLPAGLGATILGGERTVDRVETPAGVGRIVNRGAPVEIAAGVEPITQDELTTGVELALASSVRATVWAQGRWLRRGLETTGGVFDNPGRNGEMPARRDTGIVAAELATAPGRDFVMRAGYMYGRSIGSWVGAFDPRDGAILYTGSDYDAGSVNLLGRLPTDMGHRAYVEGTRTGQLGTAKLAVSSRFTVGSGRPRSVIADGDDGIIYLIPRGTAGRGTLVTQANIRIAATWHNLDITLDLFNVFDRREAVATDELYARDSVRPIVGGSEADLVFLKNDNGEEVTRRQGYGLATGFQSPFAAVLGVHQAF